MSVDAPYYERPVLLDRGRHRHLRLRAGSDFGFARQVNAIPLAGVEFSDAMKEFAIVFTRGDDGHARPVAVLGLRPRENLFVDGEGRWDAAHVPAFIRRYPFVLAQLAGGALGVCVDEACALLVQEGGEALFEADGRNSAWLDQAVDFLARWQHEYRRTEAFCARLEALGLLRPLQARADLVDGRRFTVGGLMIVDEARLAALPDAKALELFRSGELHLVSLHLASLANLQKLVDRMARRPALMPAAPRPG